MRELCVVDGVVVDPVAGPVLVTVLTAISDAFDNAEGITGPCAIMVVSGAAPALDRGLDETTGCCGQAWVRLESVYPSRNFPEPDGVPTPDPDMLSWAVTVEVGVVRPAPKLKGEGPSLELPSDEEEAEAAWSSVTDAAIVRHALLYLYPEAADEAAVLLGAYAPLGPEGGIVGGSVTATIQVT